MTIGKRIRSKRKELNLTQAELARVLKINRVSISQWENDDAAPNGLNLNNLSKVFSVTADWILTGATAETTSFDNVESVSAVLLKKGVPLLSWVQAGGFCLSNDYELPEGDYDMVLCPNPKAGPRTFALTVRGDSMTSPLGPRSYPAGSLIFVDPDVPASPGVRVIAAIADGSCTFKEYAESESGRPYLRALNPRYTIDESIEPVCICGVVIGSYSSE